MIWDCVIYNGERDLLDIRMGELAPLGAHHIVLEGRQTFQGNPKVVKPLQGSNVTHVLVDLDIEDCACGCESAQRFSPGDAWVREAHQRNAAIPYMGAGDDLVLLGDVDEVPRALDIQALSILPTRFLMDAYVFCLDWYGGKDVPGTVVARRSQITTPYEMRHADMQAIRGGWHLTYMGGPEFIKRKLAAFSHAELNSAQIRDGLDDAVLHGRVPWNGVQLVSVDGTSHLPKHVQNNIDRFKHMLRPQTPN